MLVNIFHGMIMALADSVPGVSGGTIAFILGFYDKFIEVLHEFFEGKKGERMWWPHKFGPNTRENLYFLWYFFYAAFFSLYSIGLKYPNFSFILSLL